MTTPETNNGPGKAADPSSDEITVRLRQLKLVADYGLFALRETDLAAILQRVCQAAAEGLGTQFAKLLRYRPELGDFLVIHGVGWRDGVVGQATVGADMASPAGYALHTRLPVISTLLSAETRFRTPALLAEHNVHRAINVIIGEERAEEAGEAGGEPFGVLEADSTDRDAFTGEDIAFLQALANVVFAALQRSRNAEAQAALVRDKDALMQEVHHRTKNSLQIVHTMLQLQARSVPDGDEKDRLNDAAGRIMTIAAVHRQLHEEGAVERVDLSSYMRGLMADLGRSLCPADGSRPIVVDVAPIWLAPQQAMPVGLISVELVTNALKYGSGTTGVTVNQTGNVVMVSVTDEGTGFPDDFSPTASRSLGMRLISALARSAEAIRIEQTAGESRVTVSVSLPDAAGARPG